MADLTRSCATLFSGTSDLQDHCDSLCGPGSWALSFGSRAAGFSDKFFAEQCSEKLVNEICELDYMTPLLLAVDETTTRPNGQSLFDLISVERGRLAKAQDKVASNFARKV